jgi:tetratricopeptide (TPR) repeat protein
MSENTTYLIDQLDKSLRGESNPSFEDKLMQDPALAEEWNAIQVAVATIRDAGIREQVEAVAKEFRAEKLASLPKQPSKVIHMSRMVFRVAASIVILFAVTVIYKYSTVNSSRFYSDHFVSYEMSTTRGAENIDMLEKAYRAKNWNEVIAQFNRLGRKDNKAFFLTAQANLELKNYQAAITLFKQVLAYNASGTDPYFRDEAEYYLALSYVGNGEAGKALPILEKIKGDKEHLYNRVVKDMSWVDLKIIRYKSDK